MANKASYSGLDGIIILTMVLLRLIESLLGIVWIDLYFFSSYRLGDLWMNLDGSISPICLNILALASSSSELVLRDYPCFQLLLKIFL